MAVGTVRIPDAPSATLDSYGYLGTDASITNRAGLTARKES